MSASTTSMSLRRTMRISYTRMPLSSPRVASLDATAGGLGGALSAGRNSWAAAAWVKSMAPQSAPMRNKGVMGTTPS